MSLRPSTGGHASMRVLPGAHKPKSPSPATVDAILKSTANAESSTLIGMPSSISRLKKNATTSTQRDGKSKHVPIPRQRNPLMERHERQLHGQIVDPVLDVRTCAAHSLPSAAFCHSFHQSTFALKPCSNVASIKHCSTRQI